MKNLTVTDTSIDFSRDCIAGLKVRRRASWTSPDGSVRLESKSLPALVAAIIADRKGA